MNKSISILQQILTLWANFTEIDKDRTVIKLGSWDYTFYNYNKKIQELTTLYCIPSEVVVIYLKNLFTWYLQKGTITLMHVVQNNNENKLTDLSLIQELHTLFQSEEIRDLETQFYNQLDYISSKMIQKPMIGQINYDGLVEQSLDIIFDELLKCRIDVYQKGSILSQINKVNTHIYIFNTMVECLSMLQKSADAIYICYISNHNTSDGYFGFFIKNNGNIFSINERVPEAFVGQHQNGRNHRFIENKPEGLFPYELFNIGKYDYLGYATSYTLKNQDNEEISLTNLQDMSYITLLLTILLLKFRFEDKELMEELVYSNFALDCNLQLLQENTKNNAIMTIQDSLAIQNSRNVLTDIVSSLTTKTILEGVYNEQFDSKKHPDLHYRATGEFCNNIFVELYGADFKFDPSVILQEHSLKLLGDSKATINAEFIGTKDELRLQIYQSARQQLATHIQTQMDKEYEQFKKDHINVNTWFSLKRHEHKDRIIKFVVQQYVNALATNSVVSYGWRKANSNFTVHYDEGDYGWAGFDTYNHKKCNCEISLALSTWKDIELILGEEVPKIIKGWEYNARRYHRNPLLNVVDPVLQLQTPFESRGSFSINTNYYDFTIKLYFSKSGLKKYIKDNNITPELSETTNEESNGSVIII